MTSLTSFFTETGEGTGVVVRSTAGTAPTGGYRGGRLPVHCEINTPIPERWHLAWLLFEADLKYRGRSSSTVDCKRASVGCMARCMTRFGITDPEQVTRKHLKLYLSEQKEARRGAGALAVHNDLVVWWAWFAEEYEVPNPMDGIPRPKVSSAKVAVFTPDELRRILKAVSGRDKVSVRNAAIVWLLLETGVCRTEVSELNVSDFDTKSRTITIRPETAKRGRGRTVRCGDASFAALVRWLRKHPGGEAMFTSYCGRRLTYAGVGELLTRIGEQAAVDDVRAHRFRHSFAHYWLQDGGEAVDLAQLLGHTGLTQIFAVYGASMRQQRALAASERHQIGNVIRSKS